MMGIARILMMLVVGMLCQSVYAQADRQLIRSGNRYFRQQNYAKAETEYRKAVSVNGQNAQAVYNLGCALQAQQKDSAAIVQYQNAGKMETNKMRKAKAYHNIGHICQSRQIYREAIEAYKESLRNNPDDNETRYNYVLCKRLQKYQKQNNKNDKNKQNKDKNKNKQDKNKQQNKDQKQKQSPQQNQEQMSKDNAEQLLNAAIQEEKATQQRLKKAMQQPQRRHLQKNW